VSGFARGARVDLSTIGPSVAPLVLAGREWRLQVVVDAGIVDSSRIGRESKSTPKPKPKRLSPSR